VRTIVGVPTLPSIAITAFGPRSSAVAEIGGSPGTPGFPVVGQRGSAAVSRASTCARAVASADAGT
jgi:hypothetical protein